ncbi:Armadillo-type fold [Pseudocohnilembus persalinus]|uniref:Armadillo-type fold n=1 Tax=Pseudocohnilembus persalinus TaxID=266149 RepID=A0A0V0QL10_PSEPJ|nr:Armadillo-type fold [Pseudocohnilembus persalinus]|eukprot:KRX03011.1 Armadillo-type fold [Pseudocohnilembus persalinus]
MFIAFIGRFAEAGGKDVQKYAKIIIPALLSNLSDKNSLNRSETIQCLQIWGEIIGMEQIFQQLPSFLAVDSPDMRIEVFNLMLKNPNILEKLECKPFIQPLISCITGKNMQVRALVEKIIQNNQVVIPYINNACSDFKPALVDQIKGVIQKCTAENQEDFQTSQHQMEEEPEFQNPYQNANNLNLYGNLPNNNSQQQQQAQIGQNLNRRTEALAA